MASTASLKMSSALGWFWLLFAAYAAASVASITCFRFKTRSGANWAA
jgi:hypothetical protein